MTQQLERALRASLADNQDDTRFVAELSAFVDARPLQPGDADLVELDGDDAARLCRLAQEALRARNAGIAAAGGFCPRGRLVALKESDGRGRLIATIEFDDEDELRLAGCLIAEDVILAPAAAKAANDGVRAALRDATTELQPGQGSPEQEQHE